MYDIAILINLDRREDRKKWILDHFKKRGLKDVYIYSAFDGKEINHMIVRPPKRNYFSWDIMNKNVVACALSHIGALKMAESLGCKRVLMLEDDVILSKDIISRLKLIEEESKNLDWEHIFIGGALRGKEKMNKITEHLWTSNFTDGTHAYLACGDGIKKIYNEMLHFNTTVDDAINDLIMSDRLKSYTMLPLGAYQKADKSDIDNKFIMRNDTMENYKDRI